jgi:cytochrome c553
MSSDLILEVHVASVTVFLGFYLLKAFFLLSGKDETLDVFSKKTRIVEMILSILFLVTGVSLVIITGGIKTQQIVKLALVFASIPLAIVGFKKKIKILASCSLLMLACAYVLAEAARSKPYPVKHAPAGEIAAGKYLFEHNCIYCHGKDGKKTYREAADLSLSVKDAGKVAAVIRNGGNKKMPAYGELLSEKEIAAVADYVISLRE